MPNLKHISSIITLVCVMSFSLMAQEAHRLPMQEKVENSMKYRWTKKEVLESMLLDDCESPATWQYKGMNGKISFTTDRSKDGSKSVRLRAKTKGVSPAPGNRPWGEANAFRVVNNEDWRKWNRLSVWIYPDLPGFKVVNAGIIFVNDGVRKVPGQGGAGRDYVILKNHEWNQVLTEIEYCDRDKVTGIAVQYRVQGNEPGAADSIQFDIDHIELQRVEADKVEGWDVAPGKISFSHVGYPVGAPKSAISNHLNAKRFEVIRKATGKVILSKPIRIVQTDLGEYQIMDFSEIREPGEYYIQAGNVRTDDFSIDNNVWDSTMEKSINFFYGMRCGYSIPGIHDICHQDFMATSDVQKLQINGGWHDAGDLSQGLINTSDATYAMLSLAERLNDRNENPRLAALTIEEAKWGLDWMAKTSLHNGQRVTWAVMDFWTDGIIGSSDDATTGFGSDYELFTAASAEALAYRVLKNNDPERAKRSLKLAIEDWTFGLERLKESPPNRPRTELPACAVISSFELYKSTGEKKYLDKALELAPQLVDSQERTFIPGTNISGFFYDNPEKGDKMKSDFKGSRELHFMIALTDLLEYFPQHKDWMKWYSTIAIFADNYVKNIAEYTRPFDMLPWGLTKETTGTKISGDYYLRKMPSRQGFGQLHLLLSVADALAIAGQTRNDLDAVQLAERQIEFITGMNPFSKSIMYGEGYNYHDYYNISGKIVGALPVGFPTHGTSDAIYWPPNALFAPTEVWVLPSLLLIHLLKEVAGPAMVRGKARNPVQFRDIKTGAVTIVRPDDSGNFRAMVPEGHYKITIDGTEQKIDALPCATYDIDPLFSYEVKAFRIKNNTVTIELQAIGQGDHSFEIRTENLTLADSIKTIVLKPGQSQKLTWTGTIKSVNTPWFVVAVPDGDVSKRKEALKIEQKTSVTDNADTLKIGVAVTTRYLMELVNPQYIAANPKTIATYVTKETGDIVKDLVNGKVTVAVTTRDPKDYEIQKTPTLVGTPIGVDGLVLAVSNSIPVNSLTLEQVEGIWTGKYTNWKELGGNDLMINVLGRTKEYDPIALFADFVRLENQVADGGFRYRNRGQELWGTKIVRLVGKDDLALDFLVKTPGAITYFPLQIFNNYKERGADIKALDFDGIKATPKTIADGEYFIHRRLNAITNGKPEGSTKIFVDYLLSKEGQKLIKKAGFLSLDLL